MCTAQPGRRPPRHAGSGSAAMGTGIGRSKEVASPRPSTMTAARELRRHATWMRKRAGGSAPSTLPGRAHGGQSRPFHPHRPDPHQRCSWPTPRPHSPPLSVQVHRGTQTRREDFTWRPPARDDGAASVTSDNNGLRDRLMITQMAHRAGGEPSSTGLRPPWNKPPCRRHPRRNRGCPCAGARWAPHRRPRRRPLRGPGSRHLRPAGSLFRAAGRVQEPTPRRPWPVPPPHT